MTRARRVFLRLEKRKRKWIRFYIFLCLLNKIRVERLGFSSGYHIYMQPDSDLQQRMLNAVKKLKDNVFIQVINEVFPLCEINTPEDLYAWTKLENLDPVIEIKNMLR